MSQPAPLTQEDLSPDEARRLITFFDDLETKQIEFLDGAGQRIITLCTALLGVLFGVTAFGDKFPPTYLKGNLAIKALVLAVLACYLLAIAFSLWSIQPRAYKRYRSNVTQMKNELSRLIGHKALWMRVAGGLFLLGSIGLAVLIGSLIWQA